MRIRIRKSWKTKKRCPGYWVAMGTLAAYATAGTSSVAVTYAQVREAISTPEQPPSLTVRRFDIPAGSLDEALRAFEKTAEVRVRALQEGLRSLSSPGVSGLHTPEQALKQLLNGAGVTYHFVSPKNVVVELQSLATTVDVTAAAPQLAVSTPKYAEPLRDTPQTINVVPRNIMEQQGATTLRDVLRNVAGISLAAGEGGYQGDNLTIRGFAARNDLFIDGMRDFGSYYRDPFNIEEVDVLQGPSSVTFGRGSTGGVVNQASKTPQLNRIISGGVDFGTDLTRRVTADLNMPVPKLGSGAAFRLNAMGHENNVAGRDVTKDRRFGVAPSLSLGLGSPTRWTFSYFHQTGSNIPDYGLPWLFNGPAPVDRHNFYGFRDGNFLRTYSDIGTAKVEHDFNSRVTVRNQIRYANYSRAAQITEPLLPASVTPSTPLSAIAVTRSQIAANSAESFLSNQLDLTANFETGFIRHTLITGAEGGRETSDPTRLAWSNVPATSLLEPDPDQPFSGSGKVTSKVRATAVTAAGYVLDTAKLGRKFELTGGLRWDRFDTGYTQSVAPASAFSRVDRKLTWRAAAVYKPVQAGSVYFAAGTSFNPSAESLSLSAGNANLPPERNRTYEAGTKWDVRHGRLSLRGALFRTEKLNAREPDPNNSLLNVLAGSQRVSGLQLEARGWLTSRWEMLSSYAYLDSRVVSSNYYPAAIGARLANVPRGTFNMWINRHQLPWRWDAGVGANFVSSRTASSTAPLDPVTGLVREVPGYWVFNAMARHPLAERVDLQVNVYNLANRYYYDQLHPRHIIPGPGRSALIGLRFKF